MWGFLISCPSVPALISMKRLPIIWVIVIAGILVASGSLVHLLTEAWWFDSVGFVEVFWTRLTWQILRWLGTFALYALFRGNYRLAMPPHSHALNSLPRKQ